MMTFSFADLECARLPAAALGRLACLRCRPGVEVALQGRDLWVRWDAGHDAVALALLPLAGCRLYGRHNEHWYAWGQALPVFDVPEKLRFRPLYQVIFPAPMQPLAVNRLATQRAELRLLADNFHRPTQAMECPLDQFLTWADKVPACALEHFQGAVNGDKLFVLGKNLPWLVGAERFWGRTVLVPIGYRLEPVLVEADMRRAAAVVETDILVIRREGCEIVATDRFTSLSHAALRLAGQGLPE